MPDAVHYETVRLKRAKVALETTKEELKATVVRSIVWLISLTIICITIVEVSNGC